MRVRTKGCFKCYEPKEVLYRCRYKELKDWVFLCRKCLQEVKTEFLESLCLEETGLNRLIRAGYKLLDLITFFTVGPKEARAWTVPNNSKAPEAAGVIHSDFEKGFIKVETISYHDFIECNGELGAKEAGKMRQEGRDYRTSDGDIMLFRFNV